MPTSTTTETWQRMAGRSIGRVVYTPDRIAARVAELGRDITGHYPPDEELLLVGLLKGSFMFLADLVRAIDRPTMIDFLAVSSYGTGTTSSGNVRVVYDPETDLAGKHVLLVEDIIDSGRTIDRLVPLLRSRGPLSLELCALLHKRIAPPLVLEPRWVGFDAPREFLIGYGLDHAERLRNLPIIGSL
jgi:hypoxanthine phosphoribosyltransferase